jgi:transcriptional regulator with XRE-family HTH domain
MEGAFILEISKKIRKYRQEKVLTVQELADRSGVSKGLISQIENGRSIPSLPVLFSIITSLDITVNDFFSDILGQAQPSPVIIVRKEEYDNFQKEDAIGFFYKRIIIKNLPASTIDIVLLTILPDSKRNQVSTEAFEYKYILSGTVEYEINGNKYLLNEGDSLFFDGRLPHVPRTIGSIPSSMLIVYFFEGE